MYYWKRIYEKPCRSFWNYPYIVVILEIYLGEMATIHVQICIKVALLWVSFKVAITYKCIIITYTYKCEAPYIIKRCSRMRF